jgi:hypothetical protein
MACKHRNECPECAADHLAVTNASVSFWKGNAAGWMKRAFKAEAELETLKRQIIRNREHS